MGHKKANCFITGLVVFMGLAAVPLRSMAAPFFYKKVYTPGETSVFKIQSNTEMDMSMRNVPKGLRITTSMHMNYDMDYQVTLSVVSADAKEIHTRVTYDIIKVTLEMPGIMSLVYDSSNPKDQNKAQQPAYKPFAAFVGKTLDVYQKPDGEVLRVEGLDQIEAEAVKGVPLDQKDRVAAQIQQFGRSLETVMAQAFSFLPGKPVEFNTSWTRTTATEVPMIGQVLSAIRYTYGGEKMLDGKNAVLFSSRIMDNKMEKMLTAGPIPGGVKILKTSSPPSNGSIYFDPKSGKVLKRDFITNVYLELGFQTPPDPLFEKVTMDVMVNIHNVQTLVK